MRILEILSGPVIGAVIGCFTNYIAVKMLFRPRNAINIGKYTLPFTPGIIPKRKAALAKAVGNTISNSLLGKNEIKEIIESEEMKNAFVNGVMQIINDKTANESTISTLLSDIIGEENYSQKKDVLTSKLADRITQELLNMDVGKIITDRGVEVLKQKMSNPMLSFLINEKTLKYVAVPIGEQINEYIRMEGKSKIENYVAKEFADLEKRQLDSLIVNKEEVMLKIQYKLSSLYTNFITNNIESFVNNFKINEIVEEKISNMSNESLEELTLSVVKKELDMIVYLGAVIGFVMGILNIFI